MNGKYEVPKCNTAHPSGHRRRRRPSKRQDFVRGLDAVHIIAIILTVYMLVFRVVVVIGPSMYNTLIEGDRLLLVSSLVYNQPKQGDIVVCSKDRFDDGKLFVKRVIATEGQKVYINFETGVVKVTGRRKPNKISPAFCTIFDLFFLRLSKMHKNSNFSPENAIFYHFTGISVIFW